jgi:GT2 family glycosyltransferase
VRLAVLIPVFNAHADLARSLASLDASTSLFDIVVVDDGSEAPVEAPAAATRRPVAVLRLPANGGVARALNAGLQRILDGPYEYVARLDAGDRDHPERLAAQVAYLDAHPDAALVGAWTEHVDDAGRRLFVTRYPQEWREIRRRLRYRTAFSHPACMIRTSALKTVGVYDERYTLGEDYDLFWRIADVFPCANLPRVLVTRVESKASLLHVRRREAERVRLAVQWRRFSWRSAGAWLGMLRSVIVPAVPARLRLLVKRRLGTVN